ncbi:MAG: hypothetical protein BroJett033_5920 [Chloroflexota bacterium]|nr:MAG: hypothetical protein BroJett033_5920 [Chloroflexota bacterium]
MVNGSGDNRLILIVDDTQDARELLVNWLELNSYRTLQAASGEEALRLAAQRSPDLILLDMRMPRMDGIEVCRRLKASELTADIPVIMVTGKTPGDARAEGLMAGAVDYITKPISLQDLTRRVEAALATDPEAPIDTQRLAIEVAHTALTVLESDLVWLLALDATNKTLVSQTLVVSGGAHSEAEFLAHTDGQILPRYPVDDSANPLCLALRRRQIAVGVPVGAFAAVHATAGLAAAAQRLGLADLTVVPLVAAGKTSGVMVVGSRAERSMDTPRAQQMLISLASQAATALDYERLMNNLRRRDTERELEQAFQSMILETMSDALVVIDAQGIIRFVNQRLLRMTGHPPQHLEGLSIGSLFHPDDRREIIVGLLRENASTMKFHQRLITADNQVIDVLLSRSRAQAGRPNNQVIVLTDIRLQKAREEALERQARQLMALNQAAQTITSNLSLHETLKDILNSALNVVEAQGASLFLVNPADSNELIVVAAAGYRAEYFVGLRVPFGEGVAGWVAREAHSQLVTDARDDPRFYQRVDEHSGTSTQSLIAVPLIHVEQVIGVIEVVNKLNEHAFDNDDVRLLESMAGTAVVSIANARLFDQAQRRVAELAALLSASEAASSTLELANVLEHVARSLLESLNVTRCIVMSWNPDKRRLESLADVTDAYWLGDSGPARPLTPGTLAGDAVAAGAPTLAAVSAADLKPEYLAALQSSGVPSILTVPVPRAGAVDGLITLYSAPGSPTFEPQQAENAARLTATWARAALRSVPLAAVEMQVLTNLTRQLLSQVENACWVHVETVDHAAQAAYLLREVGFAEWTRSAGSNLPVNNYPTVRAAIEQQNIEIMTCQTLPAASAERAWLEQRGGDVCLIVPLLTRGVTIGAFLLLDQNRGAFDEEEINLAQGIANVVSSALENARLYESLQSRARALESAYVELQELDRAKDQFIQNISHELRTPLIHVLGYAGLLADGALGPVSDEQRDATRLIAEKGQQIADIVGDMVAAQAQDAQVFNFTPVDIAALISQVLRAYDARIQGARLRLITHFQDGLPPVRADAHMIASAFEKLLDNALKFGAEGERIEVAIRDTDGPLVQVALRDYGIGIKTTEHEKIFHRFYQVDGGLNRQYSGSGLGLAVARSIVEGHGGRLSVKSRPNEGSIFYFTLPKYDLGQRQADEA